MPDAVQQVMGYALHLAQCGLKHEQAKPLKGFGPAGVLEKGTGKVFDGAES
jgi:phage-related protein